MTPRVVVIGPVGTLPALKASFDERAEIVEFADVDALIALDSVCTDPPTVIAVDRAFASSSRGGALLDRLHADPALAGTEIRVVSAEGTAVRSEPARTTTADGAGTLDYRGTRRVPRIRVEPVDVLVDGNPATLVDLSSMGAQVISPTVLKPNQRVRVVLAEAGLDVLRFQGTVAWANFELPKGQEPQYRAGIAFATTHEAATTAAERHRLDQLA